MDLNICNTEAISNDRERNAGLRQKNVFHRRIRNFVEVILNMNGFYKNTYKFKDFLLLLFYTISQS